MDIGGVLRYATARTNKSQLNVVFTTLARVEVTNAWYKVKSMKKVVAKGMLSVVSLEMTNSDKKTCRRC